MSGGSNLKGKAQDALKVTTSAAAIITAANPGFFTLLDALILFFLSFARTVIYRQYNCLLKRHRVFKLIAIKIPGKQTCFLKNCFYLNLSGGIAVLNMILLRELIRTIIRWISFEILSAG